MNNPSAFPLGEPNDGFAQYFDGQSWLAPVLDAPEVSIHNVTFEPGCRNHCISTITRPRFSLRSEGVATTSLRAKSRRSLNRDRPSVFRRMLSIGTVPPLTEAFSHLAFMIADGTGDVTNEWLEPVDPDAYETLR